VTLHAVQVTDPLSPGCNKSLGTIAPGKWKTYTCTKSTVKSNFTNVASAVGTSPKGVKVHDSDTANVKVTTGPRARAARSSGANSSRDHGRGAPVQPPAVRTSQPASGGRRRLSGASTAVTCVCVAA